MRLDFTWVAMALKNTLRNRRRSFVTLGIAATGTAAALLGAGFASYTYQSLAEISARDTGHVVLAAPHWFAGTEDVPLQHGLVGSAALARQLLARPGVRRVLPRLQFTGLVSNGDKSEIFVGTGVDPAQEFAVRGPFIRVDAGTLLEADAARPDIVLGRILARSLGAHPGTALTLLSTTTSGSLNALDVTVTGIVSSGIDEMDKRLAMVDLATAQGLLATDKVSTLAVYLDDLDASAATAADLRLRYAGRLDVRDWQDLAQVYRSVRGLYDRIFGFLGAIMLVVVLGAIANTLAMAVVERTREIGALRALGTTPGEVMRLFALEGMALGAAGALAGALIAAGIGAALLALGIQMPPPPGRTSGYPLAVTIAPQAYAVAMMAVTLLAALAALCVSRAAAHRPVTEALAHV
ncbi:putative ABC transport system permease protein [Pseudoduganella flava]|uniref:FtsX-like permease family protein n=1 Tax=Pseudoduganella flava TaxID=871742 RepID=A0A562PF22_9BURK|nr:FtsX-like permease family protein [Pseudoduganella flava]QGZ38927.1 FtsX-like permease family protein [Pseudoduganella flava]TWI43009.1 putative ABC transport system permease protein [Pseudoduganella flava]